MRTAFIEELQRIAQVDEDIWLLTADLGFSVLERFSEEFAQRYLNVGVAEQNMMGIAAGLALSGKRVVTYSIANFATQRCLEQIRNDVVYHNSHVVMVGVGGGFTYGAQGHTHHGLEDLAILRSLGTVDIIAPCDPVEASLAARAALSRPGPTYVRLERTGEPDIHDTPPPFTRGRVIRHREGVDLLILAVGSLVGEALTAAKILSDEGVDAAVWGVPWLVPFDGESVSDAARHYPVILTVEEACSRGGLASAVAETIAELGGDRAKLQIAAVPPDGLGSVASQASARKILKLDAIGLVGRAREALADI
ncbi:MAG: transketolase [Alphaproteobacteria bacterium]|nr:transketolase [Alphaproteobacteria bacterium]|tara:strand:- start:2666 stop:3592 length:927 start_codon:yes stop_codon:yes gene_type:complete